MSKPESKASTDIGKLILEWCNKGDKPLDITQRINECKSLAELLTLYNESPVSDEELLKAFTKRRSELEKPAPPILLNHQNKTNGTIASTAGQSKP